MYAQDMGKGNAVVRQQPQTATLRVNFEKAVNNDLVKSKFREVLGKNADAFVGSLLSLVKNNELLLKAAPNTVIAAAMQAATLKLPINQNLGLAYIVPYWNSKAKENQAQFQMGWKGLVQLAERTGQYKTINASVVYEGQIEDIDFITGNIIRGRKISDTVVGYVAYIEFLNGFSKTFYMSKEEVEAHASKYSQSYRKGYGVWKDNFDAMALKTVIKLLISKYGIMSIEMESSSLARALAADQAIMESEDETYTYADNPQDTISVEVQEPPQYARTINVNDIPPAEEPPAASIPAAEPPAEVSRPAQQGNEAESQPEECPF